MNGRLFFIYIGKDGEGMAATRLIALHINKGKTIAQCLADRTDYAQNPEKTEKGELVSGYECDPMTADEEFLLSKRQYEHITGRSQKHDVIAYQIRQSFKPGEVTAEEANKIGYETAMRWTKGRYAFIVATHTDREHIHNHIIYNSTSLDSTRKFRDFYFSAVALRRLSDIICMEHKLSVIAPKPYDGREKRTEFPKKVSHKDELCMVIDEALRQKPESFDELIQILISMGYEYKNGKNPAVRSKNQRRFIRFRSLGDDYSTEALEAIIAGTKTHKEKTFSKQYHRRKPRMSLLVDIQTKMQEGKGAGYERWAKVFNLKQMAAAMNFIETHNIRSYEQLVELTANTVTTNDGMLASIKADEARLAEIKVMMTHLQNYNKAKNVFAEYRASGYSRKYYEEHRDVLALRQAAKQAFDEYVKEHGKDTPLPKLKDLHAEYAVVLERKKKTYAEHRKQKSEMQDYLMAQKIVEVMLEKDVREQERQQLQQEQNCKQR